MTSCVVKHLLLCSTQRNVITVYPPFPSTSPYNYNSIPYICLPECNGEYNYFTVPSRTIDTPMYGVSWIFKSTSALFLSRPENPSPEETVALCLLTQSPYLHVVVQRFKPLCELYFAQNTFINLELLQAIYKALNDSFEMGDYHLPDPCSLVNTCGQNIVSLIKMILLNSRVCVNNINSAEENSHWVITILSFIPGALFPAPLNLKEIGFTAQPKRSLLHCTLSEIDLLTNVQIFAGTSVFFREMSEIDCIVSEKGVSLNGEYKKTAALTKADKIFTTELLNASKSLNYDLVEELVLRYVIGAINVGIQSKGKIFPSGDVSDYGAAFLNEFRKTPMFKNFTNDSKISGVHPSKVPITNVSFKEYKKTKDVNVKCCSGMAFPLYFNYSQK
ncbi:hypothetical protein EIN_267370 [Entamoeba invadens IP1]|uniref:AVL9/DENND6 domain-containing protein n=1 Tax=Entamoeba invadens IP1 TaxID=370355 RepID=A0A0A1U862_ENTIV|nr:hypothetical protein EIN_267370 [Entamoeba invadens IP1]ELP91021.1 hypothetical protein EIN_267370 [Entamoeba invadens IP1]|eukprot:XP_004257792.1 hypothetical protein EIN_267370 [Entamoeba invadens IP1]